MKNQVKKNSKNVEQKIKKNMDSAKFPTNILRNIKGSATNEINSSVALYKGNWEAI